MKVKCSLHRFPVLTYHCLCCEKSTHEAYDVKVSDFERQMEYLYHERFSTIFPEGANRSDHNGKHIMITFDDGYETDYTVALPIMQRYGFTGVHFVTSGFIGQQIEGRSMMAQEQLRALLTKGHLVQSHARTHRFLDDLVEEEARDELITSKYELESIVNRRIDYLSCPGGRYSARTVSISREAGYAALYTSMPGYVVGNKQCILLPRWMITSLTTFEDFKKIVSGDQQYFFLNKASYYAKYYLRKSIGNNLYHRFWKRTL